MDFYYDFESFDISPLVEQHIGKKVEDIFQNHKVISNQMGEFMKILFQEETLSGDLDLTSSKKKLLRNLKTVYYIGELTERKLLKKGVKTLYDLKINLRYRNSAKEILELIESKKFCKLCENKYIADLDVLFCFDLEELLFLDIETIGIYDSPIIILGIGFFKNSKFYIQIFFARNLGEEIAIFEHFKSEILPYYKVFVTYNGKSFDIPYIGNRFLYFFDENPMISVEDSPYENSNTRYHHIDLYHNCRRKFKGMFEDYTLTNMEQKLLGFKRKNNLPSSLVGLCYRMYLDNPLRHVGLIKEVIEHNYWDIYAMPLILRKLIEV
ncbi:MAG: ribonuclease H-like domain-containing protein [Candidatus Hodarchaeota archaeon]